MTASSPTAALFADMQAWRHDFHSHPELGFEETRTSSKVAELLASFGVEVHAGVGGTGVVGVLKKGSSAKSLALRADMDALPIVEATNLPYRSETSGKMHACGHDGHTATLLGAAAHLAKSGDFDGTVYFFFQPAEEHGRGALAMMNDGLFDRFPADAVYGMHNMPSIPQGNFATGTGPMMACEDNFEIVVEGKGTHAAMPHMGIDPIVLGSELVLSLQSVVSRSVNPVEKAVVSVTEFITDGSRNILPSQVVLRGDVRAFDQVIQDQIKDAMESRVAGICATQGATYSFSYSHEFVATVNTAAETEATALVAEQVVGSDRVNREGGIVMGSEDFGHMLRKKPGCFFFLGNDKPGQSTIGLHSPQFDFNDELLTIGADLWVSLVESELK